MMAVVLILSFVSVIGIYKVYPSPYTYKLSQQVGEKEVNGVEFIFQYKDMGIRIVDYYPVGCIDLTICYWTKNTTQPRWRF